MSSTFSTPPTVSTQPKYFSTVSLASSKRKQTYKDHVSTLTWIELITMQNTGTAT